MALAGVVASVTVTVNGKTSCEVRYFIGSKRCSVRRYGKVLRNHWGIENNHNWTMDVALVEDDVQPCQQSRDAIEVVAWLRVLGYNLLAAWRAQADKKDQSPMPWARCMEQLRDAFTFVPRAVQHATLA